MTQALSAYAHRSKQDRRTAASAQIKVSGFLGGYSRITDFICEWRANEGKKSPTHLFR